MSNIIVFAPHPDDETLGCGGTLLKHIEAKDKVHWAILTDIYTDQGFTEKIINTRKKEINQVKNKFKFASTHQLNFRTTELDKVPMNKLILQISHLIKKIKPEILYVPFYGDIHSDHFAAFNAISACTKSFRYPFIKKILAYETISETEFTLVHNNVFKPNCWVDITKYLSKKINIMSIYKSEVGTHPFPRSKKNIEALATFRGATINKKAAESFMILKDIR